MMLFKIAFFICVYMLVRWTLPRFRFDQLMGLAWTVLIPLTLVYLLCAMCVREFAPDHRWLLTVASVVLLVGTGAVELWLVRGRPKATRRILKGAASVPGVLTH